MYFITRWTHSVSHVTHIMLFKIFSYFFFWFTSRPLGGLTLVRCPLAKYLFMHFCDRIQSSALGKLNIPARLIGIIGYCNFVSAFLPLLRTFLFPSFLSPRCCLVFYVRSIPLSFLARPPFSIPAVPCDRSCPAHCIVFVIHVIASVLSSGKSRQWSMHKGPSACCFGK